MRFFQVLLLLLAGTAAAFSDLQTGKIPNSLILAALTAGFFWQTVRAGLMGPVWFVTGAGIPVLLLWILYSFRMIGAGDVKLLAAMGGLLGPGRIWPCMFWALLAGGVYALIKGFQNRNLRERLLYFQAYLWNYLQTGEKRPYLTGENVDSRLCLAVPVLISVWFYAGGVY